MMEARSFKNLLRSNVYFYENSRIWHSTTSCGYFELLTSSSMNREQSACMGESFTVDEYHPLYKDLHPLPHEDSFDPDEEEQTYSEFVEMGKRNPNSSGTGRWKINSQRYKMLLVSLGSTEAASVCIAPKFKDLVSAFFQLPVDYLDLESCIIDATLKLILEGVQYDIREWTRKQKGSKTTQQRRFLDVFSLFDALTSIAKKPYISILALVHYPLAEASGRGFVEVLGRACGDRVACVSTTGCENFKTLLTTSLHELLHTVGFDHCNSFRCVMNAIQPADGQDWLFLCPPNLRKLKDMHGISESLPKSTQNSRKSGDNELQLNRISNFLLSRYERMLDVLHSYHDHEMGSFDFERSWLQSKITAMYQVLGSKSGRKRDSKQQTDSEDMCSSQQLTNYAGVFVVDLTRVQFSHTSASEDQTASLLDDGIVDAEDLQLTVPLSIRIAKKKQKLHCDGIKKSAE